MIPWTLIDTAKIAGGGELRLKRRGEEFSIMLGGNELMNSRMSGSETALATLSRARIRGRPRPKMLIGGLGMGFTLRGALAELGADASITVAELAPQVVTWARGPLAAIFAGCLDDPRVTIHEGDVASLIGAQKRAWDAILLDVDNGPAGLTAAANDGLYTDAGLAAAYAALNPGGVLSVWSSAPDAGFTRRLRQGGFAVEEIKVRAHAKRGLRHVVWVGVKDI